MTAFVTDTFTEGSNTNLNAHTPEVGGAWSYAMGTWTVVGATDVVQLSSGQEFAWNSASPPGANYYVEAVGRTVATNATDRFGVAIGDGGGYAAVGTDCYYLYVTGAGSLVMLEQANGSIAAPSSYSGDYTIPGFSASTDYTIRLDRNGSTLTGYLDGVARVTATDSTFSANGQAGIYLRNSSAYITSLSADDGVSSLTLPVTKADITITGQSLGLNLSMAVSPVSVSLTGQDISLTSTQPTQGGGSSKKKKHKLPPTTAEILRQMKQEEEIPFVPPPVEEPKPQPIAADEVREIYDDRPDRAQLAVQAVLIAKKVIQRKRNEAAARMLLGL